MYHNYYSPSCQQNSPTYQYINEYTLPSTSTYFYSPSAQHQCPVHPSQNMFASVSSFGMNTPPVSYSYYQQSETEVKPPFVMEQPAARHVIDHTPLRRHRCFKKTELQLLHQWYIRDPHPSTDLLQQLAVELKSPIEKVRQWFKNRRHSDKQRKRTIPSI